MSEPETTAKNFLLRWSQRKHAAHRHADRAATPDQDPRPEADDAPRVVSEDELVSPGFDPETLPPIESITAISDVRAFLAHGVPEELTRAALRRAWIADPTIRDFVGIAENQWDFTQAGGVPGFGPLELTAELRRMIADLVGDTDGQGVQARRDDTMAETAKSSMPPMGCVAPEERQEPNSERQDKPPTQSASVADVSVPPLAGDHAAAQENRSSGTANEALTESRRPRRHGSAVPK